MPNVQLHLGDCLSVMAGMPADSIDAICTDPPAGISFMSAKWDGDKGGRRQWIAWMTEVAAECLRVIRPGGHALVWALPRTSHWTATAWEDAGFEIRDCVYHIFGSGFPKSHDVSKALDRMAGAEREVIGYEPIAYPDSDCWGVPNSNSVGDNFGVNGSGGSKRNTDGHGNRVVTAPATDAAKQYSGFGTALKPSVECWWLLRKPLSEPTIAANVLKHGTGGINVDACRVEGGQRPLRENNGTGKIWAGTKGSGWAVGETTQGRWPANLLLSDDAAALLDEMSGVSKSPETVTRGGKRQQAFGMGRQDDVPCYADQGGASRFFARFAPDADDEPLRMYYCAKASRRDRSSDGTVNNTHSTVKPQKLMRWLVRLCTPPGGTILDPFLGSGTTGVAAMLEGFNFIGIEKEAEYLDEIARARIDHARQSIVQPMLELT